MLEIALCSDRREIVPVCRSLGLPYSEALYLYRATDREEELAHALFEVRSDCVRVAAYHGEEDAFLFDGLLRAGFHYAEGQGIEQGWIPEELRYRHRSLFAKLNYPASPHFNIVNFFSKYKNCAR